MHFFLVIGRSVYLGKEGEMLVDCEGIKENVVLWAEAKALAHTLDVLANVMTVDESGAAGWSDEALKNREDEQK
jgi:hypothetical protein